MRGGIDKGRMHMVGGKEGKEAKEEEKGRLDERRWIDRRRRQSNGGRVTQRLWQHVPPYSPNNHNHNENMMTTTC